MSNESNIDAIIAEQIMEIPVNKQGEVIQFGLGCGKPHRYSSKMEYAWKIIEKLCGPDTGMDWEMYGDPFEGEYAVKLRWVHDEGESDTDWVKADNICMAICLAALQACGVKIKYDE